MMNFIVLLELILVMKKRGMRKAEWIELRKEYTHDESIRLSRCVTRYGYRLGWKYDKKRGNRIPSDKA